MELSHLKRPRSAPAIFDAIEMIDIAQKRILLLYYEFIHKTEGTMESFFGSV